MSTAGILAQPNEIGDLSWINGGGTASVEFASAQLPAWTTGDPVMVISLTESVPTIFQRLAGLVVDANNHFCFRSESSSNYMGVDFRIGGVNTIARITTASISGNSARNNQIRAVAWTETTGGSTKTTHFAHVGADGTITRAANTGASSGFTLAALASGAVRLGEFTTGVFASSGIADFLIGEANTTLDATVMTDAVIRMLADDPQRLLSQSWMHTDRILTQGDYCDPSGERLLLKEITALSASNKAVCPNTGAEGTITVNSGSPTVYPPYTPARTGFAATAQINQPAVVPIDGTARAIVGACAGGSDNKAYSFHQILDGETGRVFPSVVIPYASQYTDTGDGNTVKESYAAQNNVTDPHNADAIFTLPGAVVSVSSRHHQPGSVGGDTTQEVLNVTIRRDAGTTVLFPDFDTGSGPLAPTERDTSYVQGVVIGSELVFFVRRKSSSAGELWAIKLDTTDDSFTYQKITQAGGATTGQARHWLPVGVVLDDDSDTFACVCVVIYNQPNASGGGIAAVIGSASGFADPASWFNAANGEACDGIGGRPTLGSIDPDDQDFELWTQSKNAAFADRDRVAVGDVIGRSGYVTATIRENTGNVDEAGTLQSDDFHRIVWAFDRTTGVSLSELHLTSLRSAIETQLTSAQFQSMDWEDCATLVDRGDAGHGGLLFFADPETGLMTDAEAQFAAGWWGRSIGCLTIPDARQSGVSAESAERFYRISVGGGLACRPMRLPGGRLIADRYLPIEILVDNGGALAAGTVVPFAVDVGDALATLPSGSSRATRAVRARTVGARGVRDVA